MDPVQLAKRKKIMTRSIKLGHCVCDPQKPCPCPVFKAENVCECAGETRQAEIPVGEVKLTDHVRSAGCASKIGKKDLKEVLSGLPEINDPRVLVGSNAGDDAGVIVLSEDDEQALILTVDVFAPSVDDAYTFGQIAAANSVSDVYAMGGTPQSALSIVGFPIHNLPNAVMHEILRGGVDKMKEAGIAVVGGHSINDEEIKCGFAVVGSCPRNGFVRNDGAQVSDALVLTKPLGIGITAFAAQIGRAEDESVEEISQSMAALNKTAAEKMVECGAHAATDVTGYSLIGHLAEIVKNSKVAVELDFDAIPLFRQVQALARQEVLPGAVERNREAVDPDLLEFSALAEAQRYILFCPETSGGLLVFLPGDKADDYVAQLQAAGIATAAIIGRVCCENADGKIIVTTAQADEYSALKLEPLASKQADEEPAASCCPDGPPAEPSCCSDATVVSSCTAKSTAGSGCCPSPPAEPSCCDKEAEAPSCCADPPPENKTLGQAINPAADDAFKAYMAAVMAPGAIDLKNKKLMALALSVATKCEPCIKIDTRASQQAGASDAEIGEAVSMGIAFGGAPTAMFYNTVKHKV